MKRLSPHADTDIHLLLMAAVFAVFMGYGALLPVLAPFIEHLADKGGRYDVSWHAGMLTGVYTLALFAFAPVCGRLSDRAGQRPVLLTGLAGYVVTLLLFGLSLSLGQAYAMRIASGVFAAAVLPVAMAFAGASHPTERRARRFAWLSAASGLGLLAGPALSGITTREGAGSGDADLWHVALASPFGVAAILGAVVWLTLFFRLPRGARGEVPAAPDAARGRPTLFLMVLLLMFGLGAFEVAIVLRAQRLLGLTPAAISVMFMECSVVMIAAQIAVFWSSPSRLYGPLLTVSGFVAMAGGMALLPYSDSYLAQVGLVGMIAAASGILIPLLSYRVSQDAGDNQGAALGKSVAAGNLGQAAGSFAAGVLFDVRPEAPFWLGAGLLLAAALAAARLAASGVPLQPNEEGRG
ncbi:MFS transporter [Aromatoleum evansii]|uniref:MFS transporter n=1 Tax=Aromatoleum evansii TaxID=59406 RepID=UPI00145C8ED2|nr:MFS transporter [Aromatoleum evansii]NMG29971.1 MFS transporter [Aromatoleum evansii]